MDIVIAVHHFPPNFTGGAEGQALRQALALKARGHRVRVICVERIDAGEKEGVSWQDEEYSGLPVRRLSFNLRQAPDSFRYTYDNLWIGDHLRAWLSADRPDVFHLIGGYLMSGQAILAPADLRIPVVVSLMDLWFLCPRISMMRSDGSLSTFPIEAARCAQCLGEEKRIPRWLGKTLPGPARAYWQSQHKAVRQIEDRTTALLKALRRADLVISNSQFLRGVFTDAGIDPDRLVYMRQGRDFIGLDDSTLCKSPSRVLRLGYLGQIAELKGLHVLLESVRSLPDRPLQLTLYGDTARFPAYTRRLEQISAGDPRIRFAGQFFDPGAATQALREMDALVVPSIWYENSPNVILEAFAHRTPVIASNLGGMAELVDHDRSGLLFTAGEPADLARQITRLLEDPTLLQRLTAGIDPIRSEDEETADMLAVYQQLAQKVSS